MIQLLFNTLCIHYEHVVASYQDDEMFQEKPIIISTKYSHIYLVFTTVSKDVQCGLPWRSNAEAVGLICSWDTY